MYIREIWETFLDFIFPPKCLICNLLFDARNPYRLCPLCLSDISYTEPPSCDLCGMPFKSKVSSDHLCGECLTTKRYFKKTRSLGLYQGTLLKAIHLLKYNARIHLASSLGNMLADSVSELFDLELMDLLIPVPLHPRRLRERGFNQALLLARSLEKRLNVPLNPKVLRRIRYTEHQVNLSRSARKKNVRGVFAVSDPSLVKGKNILLVDDVYTTGATVNECGRILLKSGANEVYVLTVARSVM